MKPAPFAYHRPATLGETLELLARTEAIRVTEYETVAASYDDVVTQFKKETSRSKWNPRACEIAPPLVEPARQTR